MLLEFQVDAIKPIICELNLRCTKFICYLLHRIITQKSHSCVPDIDFCFFFLMTFDCAIYQPFVFFMIRYVKPHTQKDAWLSGCFREREKKNKFGLRHINYWRINYSCGVLAVVRETSMSCIWSLSFMGFLVMTNSMINLFVIAG